MLKDELDLDHFEGRSWTGFHHHAALTFLAYGFLVLEQQRSSAESAPSRSRGLQAPPGEAQRGA